MLQNTIRDIAIIGGGAWGTAIGKVIADSIGKCTIYLRNPEIANEINKKNTNSKYLKDVILPSTLKATTDFGKLNDHQAIIIVVPSIAFRSAIESLENCNLSREKPIIIATKGLDSLNGDLLTNITKTIFPTNQVAILSGPNLAEEVAEGNFSPLNIACTNLHTAKIIAELFNTPTLLTSVTIDIITPQIAGTIKNIIAILAGIFDALKLGYNAKAFLVTQGLKEIRDLTIAIGGDLKTCFNVSAIGDLSLGVNSNRSRNYLFGYELTCSKTPGELIAAYPYLVEGIYACKTLELLKSRYKISLPLCEIVINILKEPINIKNSILNIKELVSA